jgi:hypothetical protein
MAFSLWLVVTMQAIIVTIIVLITVKEFLNSPKYFFHTLLIIIFLSFTTGISYYISQIMPDFLSAVGFVCLALLICYENLNRFVKILLIILLIFSNMAHSSNLITTTAIVFIIILINFLFRKHLHIPSKRIYLALFSVAAGWLITPCMNSALGAGFTVSRAPNIFIMGRLVESGVLNQYLKDNCGTKNISMCKYIDHLPQTSGFFLWPHESPLYDGGCLDEAGHMEECWLSKNETYKPIVSDILFTPKYLGPFLRYAFKQTTMQLVSIKNDSLDPMMEGSPVIGNIAWRFKNEYQQYINSDQSKAPYRADFTSGIQSIIIVACLFILFSCFIFKKLRDNIPFTLRIFSMILFLGILINAATCATFSMVANRFEGRVIWLLVLITILIMCFQFKTRVEITKHN